MITSILYYILFFPISFLPLRILYIFSHIFYVIIKIFGYRKEVVFSNLANSFPEKTENEIIKNSNDFFKHFSEIITEIIKMISAI